MPLLIFLQGDFGSVFGGMWPILAMFVVIYFFMIRPQAKKTKEQNKFVASMEKGDEVVTSSGIIGRISKIEDNIVHLQVDSKSYIKILRSNISKELTAAIQSKKEE